jgi:dTDP-4-dehydrorhamnose 3,5-epimerase/CDP-3, 6-dideoxy-D-glycero-D-glycero-4-hexulose-5-epimerase
MNIEVKETDIPEVKILKQFSAKDDRGTFVKTFHTDSLIEMGIDFNMKESFYSVSNLNVIRGMHFHAPPYDHAKIVFCTAGKILDIALDIRKESQTYGKFVTAELSFENKCALLIPKGFAHGFLTLSQDATTFYFVDGVYNREADGGVLYNSFGMNWNVENPIISSRDLAFNTLANFSSPF